MNRFRTNVMSLDEARQVYVIHMNPCDNARIRNTMGNDLDTIALLASYMLEYINEKRNTGKIEEEDKIEEDKIEGEEVLMNLWKCYSTFSIIILERSVTLHQSLCIKLNGKMNDLVTGLLVEFYNIG